MRIFGGTVIILLFWVGAVELINLLAEVRWWEALLICFGCMIATVVQFMVMDKIYER